MNDSYHRRDPLSFPTRRSSDLPAAQGKGGGQAAGGPARVRPRAALGVEPRRLAGVPEDRKSTRLNSSHLVISYAVFCLKKKKKLCRKAVMFITRVFFQMHVLRD